MKIGYPCINNSLDCTSSSTFRLESYSEKRLCETVENNLNCLLRILKYNVKKNILFFRISSDLIPFASHPICKFKWGNKFKNKFREIGNFIKLSDIRISMSPDQFIVLNSNKEEVFKRSVKEIEYHGKVLDLMGLDNSAKIQLHVGGVCGDKGRSKNRFIKRYNILPKNIKNRLVIENDDTSYTVSDCLSINEKIGIPILFDKFHHEFNSSGESIKEVMEKVSKTWSRSDGIPMVDYSSALEPGNKKHVQEIDSQNFKIFLSKSKPFNFDVMLEIKNKEKSAIEAIEMVRKDVRFMIS